MKLNIWDLIGQKKKKKKIEQWAHGCWKGLKVMMGYVKHDVS